MICACVLLTSCSQYGMKKSDGLSEVDVVKTLYYEGVDDDLLTAGLGLKGLRSTPPLLPSDATAAELRQASYYHQFKALNDFSTSGGFGDLYGFDVDHAPIAGFEYWGQRSVAPQVYHTVVLQIPDEFDVNKACLVVAPSSGSRNVFGAVGTSGAWALLNSCAVVYTDKGTGTQVALSDQKNYQIDGLIADSADPQKLIEATELTVDSALHVVQKHPYSKVNPEQYWGDFVLDAAAYGLALINQKKGLLRNEVKVIAASVSNGGGAVLRAAEMDHHHLLDAVVAAEPQINLNHQYKLKDASGIKSIDSKPLIELSMKMSLYEPCAALHDSLNGSPFKMNTVLIQGLQQQRCAALKTYGYLEADELKAQATESLNKIKQLHIEPIALQLSQLNTLANMWGAINHTYSNSYLKKSAKDNLCQSAMSAFTSQGLPRVLSDKELAQMFAMSNGIAPSNGVELAFTNANNEVQSKMVLAPGYGIESQACFIQLLSDTEFLAAVEQIKATPENNTLPTIILHGQADGTVAINHASRAYFHRHQSRSLTNQLMRYYEIEHVQHFDAFLAYPGFDQNFVPMHPYFEQALDLMYAHLFDATDLPASQLIKTTTRGLKKGVVPALGDQHIPAINTQPKNPISVNQQQLEVE